MAHSADRSATITNVKTPNPFAMVSKTLLNDERLSWGAKGIAAYLVGKPDGWKMRVTDLVKHGTDGKYAVRSALNELRNLGYAEFIQGREGGRMSEGEWRIADKPVFSPRTNNQDTAAPRTNFPHPENQDTKNRHLSNNDSNKNDSNKNDVAASAKAKTPKPSNNQPINHPSALPLPPPSSARPPATTTPAWLDDPEMIDDPQPALLPPAGKLDPKKKARGTIEEFQAFAKSIGLETSDGEAMFWKLESNGWQNGKGPVKDWKAHMRQYKASGYHPSQQRRANSPRPQQERTEAANMLL